MLQPMHKRGVDPCFQILSHPLETDNIRVKKINRLKKNFAFKYEKLMRSISIFLFTLALQGYADSICIVYRDRAYEKHQSEIEKLGRCRYMSINRLTKCSLYL